jgi:hypothetical protein
VGQGKAERDAFSESIEKASLWRSTHDSRANTSRFQPGASPSQPHSLCADWQKRVGTGSPGMANPKVRVRAHFLLRLF